MTMLSGSTAGGAVYDRGYRPYEGQLGGRREARWALFRMTVRRALGIRRSWRQKVLPWSLLAVVTVPAVVNVGARFATRDTPVQDLDFAFFSYRDYVGLSNALLVFVAVMAPDAVCRDRHDRVLPLLFSRPLTGIDYVVAKVAAMAAIVFGFSYLPQVVLFVGQMFVHPDGSLDYASENAEILWQVPAAVAVLALFLALVSVALSSLTDRRLVAGVAILGLALITSSISALLVEVGREDDQPAFSTGSSEVVEEPARSGTVEAGSGGQVGPGGEPGGPYPGESVPPGESPYDYDQRRSPSNVNTGSAAALINVFGIPLHVRDLIFLGHVEATSSLGGVDGGGTMAVLAYLAIVLLSAAVLLWRYREIKL